MNFYLKQKGGEVFFRVGGEKIWTKGYYVNVCGDNMEPVSAFFGFFEYDNCGWYLKLDPFGKVGDMQHSLAACYGDTVVLSHPFSNTMFSCLSKGSVVFFDMKAFGTVCEQDKQKVLEDLKFFQKQWDKIEESQLEDYETSDNDDTDDLVFAKDVRSAILDEIKCILKERPKTQEDREATTAWMKELIDVGLDLQIIKF